MIALGYEKYNTIRADPALCFLERVGKPDEKAVAAEQRANDYMDGYVHLSHAFSLRLISISIFCVTGFILDNVVVRQLEFTIERS